MFTSIINHRQCASTRRSIAHNRAQTHLIVARESSISRLYRYTMKMGAGEKERRGVRVTYKLSIYTVSKALIIIYPSRYIYIYTCNKYPNGTTVGTCPRCSSFVKPNTNSALEQSIRTG